MRANSQPGELRAHAPGPHHSCSPEPSISAPDANDSPWHPYTSHVQFEVADFLFRKNQMSAGDIDTLLQLWSDTLSLHGDRAPFSNHREMYRTIDASPGPQSLSGDARWQSFRISYGSEDHPQAPPGPRQSWMDNEYVVWFRNPEHLVQDLIANPDFVDEFDYVPYHEYRNGLHRFSDFMSGDWAWKQAVGF
jgi:Plavaka transposase